MSQPSAAVNSAPNGSNGRVRNGTARSAKATGRIYSTMRHSAPRLKGQTLWTHVRENVLIHSGGLRQEALAHIRTAVEDSDSGGHALCVEIVICGDSKNPQQVTKKIPFEYGDYPDLLSVYKFHQLLTAIPFLPLDGPHLIELYAVVNGREEILREKRRRRIQKRFGEQIAAVANVVPSAESVLQALAMVREFGIELNTESLTRLAVEKRFRLTPQLLQSGVESVESYLQHQFELDQMYASIAGTLSEVCNRCDVCCDDYKPVIGRLMRNGVESRRLLLAYAISLALEDAIMRGSPDDFFAATAIRASDVPMTAVEVVVEADGLGRKKADSFRREFQGLLVELHYGG